MFLKELKREETTKITIELTSDEVKLIHNVLSRCVRNGGRFTEEQKYFAWKFGNIRDLIFHGQVDNLCVRTYERMFPENNDGSKSPMPEEIENPNTKIGQGVINMVDTGKYDAFKKKHSVNCAAENENLKTHIMPDVWRKTPVCAHNARKDK